MRIRTLHPDLKVTITPTIYPANANDAMMRRRMRNRSRVRKRDGEAEDPKGGGSSAPDGFYARFRPVSGRVAKPVPKGDPIPKGSRVRRRPEPTQTKIYEARQGEKRKRSGGERRREKE